MGLYPSRPRTRIVPARVVTGDAALFARLTTPEYDAPVEQAIVIHVEAWDRNCQQHIPRLIRLEDARQALGTLRERVATLEAELRALKGT